MIDHVLSSAVRPYLHIVKAQIEGLSDTNDIQIICTVQSLELIEDFPEIHTVGIADAGGCLTAHNLMGNNGSIGAARRCGIAGYNNNFIN